MIKRRRRFVGNRSTRFTGLRRNNRPLSAIQVGGPEKDGDDGYDDPAKCLTVCHFLIPLTVSLVKKLSHQSPLQSPRFVDLIAHDVCRCLLCLVLSREPAEWLLELRG